MNVKDLFRFMALCEELGITPTWELLNNYKRKLKAERTARTLKIVKVA